MIAPNGYIFLYDNKTYQLAFDKIHDVILHENYKEFLQPYGLDSSLRIQSQRVSSTSYTLNFLYKDGDFINEIIFSCPSRHEASLLQTCLKTFSPTGICNFIKPKLYGTLL